jgi:DNA-binding NarL/FixJ family response regulator
VTICRILIVDDFAPLRLVLSWMVRERAEFEVVGEAEDGLEGIQKAEELQPHLVLLDVGLPKMDGLEASRRIREVAPEARILFVSLQRSPDMIQDALSTGALGFVLKQHIQTDLLPAIDAVLAGERFVSRNLDSDGEGGPT